VLAALLATAVAAVAAAAGASAPAGADARIAAAERTLAAVESSGCPENASPERAAADAAEGRLAPDASRALDAAREDLRLYFACRAFAAGSPGPCAALSRTPAHVSYSEDKSALKRPDTLEFLCVSDLQDMRMARAAISGDSAGFSAACRAHDSAGHRDFARGRVDEACAILADGARDPAGACRRLQPLFSNPAPAGYCEGELLQFAGDEKRCLAIRGQPASRELCLGYSAWRRSRAGDRTACAGLPVCRVLDGDGAGACGPLSARALSGYCAARSPAALREAEAGLDEAEKELDAFAGAGLEDARSADRLLERVARARLRLARLRPAREAKTAP
jgi:hypothetical protein